MVKKILHLEGLIILLTTIYFYDYIGGNWFLFAILLLSPDLSMLGYLKNKQLGTKTYNLVHNYIFSLILVCAGFFLNYSLLIQLGLIATAHVAMDRMLGFGLKYSTKFKDTHLQHV